MLWLCFFVSCLQVDFRQLYFRTAHKLTVARACEPSDVLWRSLRVSKASSRAANLRTTALAFLVACVSTAAITAANFMGTSHSSGAITTLWVTAVVIGSNVAIFCLVPYLAVNKEFHHHRSAQHMHMLLKMAFFQCFNTSISVRHIYIYIYVYVHVDVYLHIYTYMYLYSYRYLYLYIDIDTDIYVYIDMCVCISMYRSIDR